MTILVTLSVAVRVNVRFAGLAPTSEKGLVKRIKKRVEVGDANAMFNMGCCYDEGRYNLPRDHAKALDLWHQAGKLGCAAAYHNIGNVYYNGEGVKRDEKKADHYYKLAAMGGYIVARYNLGCSEYEKSYWDRAIKHFMIAAGDGDNDSVKAVQQLYKHGHATKGDYSKALLAYQKYVEEARSEQRDEAAAANDRYKYIMD